MVRLQHRVADHRLERRHGRVVEVLDQAEVEEGDLPARAEQVVAGVGSPLKAWNRYRLRKTKRKMASAARSFSAWSQVSSSLQVAPGPARWSSTRAVDSGGEHRGDVDEGMPPVEVGERLLVGGLDPVVELLADPGLDLGHERLRGPSPGRAASSTSRGGRRWPGRPGWPHRPRGTGPSPRQPAPRAGCGVPPQGAVDLADRRRRDRLRVPLDEQLLRARRPALRRRRRLPAPGSWAAPGRGARPAPARSGSGKPSSR